MKYSVHLILPSFLVFFLSITALQSQIFDEKGIVAPGATVEKFAKGFTFTEGPAVDKKGNIFFTDQPNNRILKWSVKGELSTFTTEAGRSNGMYFDKKGRLIACADMDNQLWAFDENAKPAVLLKNYEDKLLNGPNDLWIDPKGGIYFTDPLYKRNYWKRNPDMQQDGEHVYYITPGGKNIFRVDEDLEKPNGIIGTPDGKKLYVADIRANKTYEYSINADGTLSGKKLFAELGSDGMTIDKQGNIYLTGKGVTVFDKSGKQIAHIPIDANWTANVCFGGKDRRLLFITAMDAVYGLRMKVKGVQ